MSARHQRFAWNENTCYEPPPVPLNRERPISDTGLVAIGCVVIWAAMIFGGWQVWQALHG